MPEVSSAISFKDAKERDAVNLEHASGAICQIHKHGATLTSWKPKILLDKEGSQVNAFYMSEAEWSDKDEIWGGVPICFPQFAAAGKLAIHHGFARFSNEWVVEDVGLDGEDMIPFAIFTLKDSEETRSSGFDHAFTAKLTIKLYENELSMALQVTNDDPKPAEGEEAKPMKITFAFHNYLSVPDIMKAKLTGLDGVQYFNKVTSEEKTEERKEVTIHGEETDNIYRRASHPVVLHLGEGKGKITIEKKNCKDYVIWNIGKENIVKYPALKVNDWRHYVCIEAAQAVKAIAIAPGDSWTFEQKLTYSDQ